jgi:hypothetical protein
MQNNAVRPLAGLRSRFSLFLGRAKNGGSKEKISDWDAYAERMKKVRDSYVWFLLFLLEGRV